MTTILYRSHNFKQPKLDLIERANDIISDFQAQGYSLTLRQLYYQFVARDLIPNTERSYKNLGTAISDGRMAGLIDWYAIEDRTRSFSAPYHWDDMGEILDSTANSFATDKWEGMDTRVEIWVEKEALANVVERPARNWNCGYFCCRGYVSQSAQWRAGQRILEHIYSGQNVVILHLGDHDPSGIDMTRDIEDRVREFAEFEDGFTVKRIALNMEQVEELQPPPNPAKVTDSRFRAYRREFGEESWELDALQPVYIDEIIAEHIQEYIDPDIWRENEEREKEGRRQLRALVSQVKL